MHRIEGEQWQQLLLLLGVREVVQQVVPVSESCWPMGETGSVDHPLAQCSIVGAASSRSPSPSARRVIQPQLTR